MSSDTNLEFEKDFNAVVLMVAGIFPLIFGYSRFSRKTKARLIFKRLLYFLFGYAFFSIVLLQIYFFGKSLVSDVRLWILLTVLVPFGGSIIMVLFSAVGILGVGIQVSLILTTLLKPVQFTPVLENLFPKEMVILGLSFLGGILCLWLHNKKYHIILSYITAACGISFFLSGLNCFIPQVPSVRAFDFKEESYRPNPSAESTVEKAIFYAITFGTPILCLFIQKFVAIAISKLFKSKPKKVKASKLAVVSKYSKLELQDQKPSLWHFVRHKGEYLAFKTHKKHLARVLVDLNMNVREVGSNGIYADDSQYVVLSDQLRLVSHREFTPAEIHKQVVSYLENKNNWDLLCSQTDDLFEMRDLNRLEYCRKMKSDFLGDFITLQAIAQVYQIPVCLISSIWDPPVVEFPVIPQHSIIAPIKSSMDESIAFGVEFVEPHEIQENHTEGIVTLVGSDGRAVRCSKSIAMKAPTIANFIAEATEAGTDVIYFDDDPTLTGDVLFNICKRLEALHILSDTSLTENLPTASLRYLDIDEIFIQKEKPEEKQPLMVSHYWGSHYGSLESRPKNKLKSELNPDADVMRIQLKPHTRMALIRVLHILIILSGAWWLIWMAGWGYKFDSFWTGLQFLLFWCAELINYTLGIIYNMNFWSPTRRKWKSLDRLTPAFLKNIIVNCMIFHYSEDVRDTARTIGGALRMKTTPGTQLRVYICDDGFWKYPPKPQVKLEPWLQEVAKKWWKKIPSFRGQKKKEKIDEISEEVPLVQPERKFAKSSYEPKWPGEAEMLEFIKEEYGCAPKEEIRDMLAMIAQEMYRFYSEKLHCRVKVSCKIEIGTIPNKEIIRSDCAKATVRYHFFAEYYGRIAGPEIILIGRVKPDKHHYKAGNINNAIYNNRMEGDFSILLDNDMKPTPDFVLRTVPWFYYFDEQTGTYEIDKAVSFIQSPQFFKASTIASDHDFLGGRNSVFFQGIQVGRDGFDLCAFAGTNAIFNLTAMRTVKGLPYGSLTEDANLAIYLHRYGFRSIYVEDKLAVGLAPVTVANSMQQRSRWVKGSVQILQCNIWPKGDMIVWEQDTPYPIYSKEDIDPFMVPLHKRGSRNIFRMAYALDTMFYPFSAVTAILYMLVAFLFLVVGQSPLNFTRPPFSYQAFLVTFLPYFLLKFFATYLSYNRVRADDIWVSQEIWFSYSIPSFFGIVDAATEAITGRASGGWGVTGEGKRISSLEWYNTGIFMILSSTILVRFVMFLIEPSKNITMIAAIFFAITVVIQMWPMVSTSLYEYMHNSHLPTEEKVDLHRYKVANYIGFSFILILGIFVSVFAIGDLTGTQALQ